MDKYKITGYLGEGKYGIVFSSGDQIAIKIECFNKIKDTIEILDKLKHSELGYVVKIYDHFIIDSKQNIDFPNNSLKIKYNKFLKRSETLAVPGKEENCDLFLVTVQELVQNLADLPIITPELIFQIAYAHYSLIKIGIIPRDVHIYNIGISEEKEKRTIIICGVSFTFPSPVIKFFDFGEYMIHEKRESLDIKHGEIRGQLDALLAEEMTPEAKQLLDFLLDGRRNEYPVLEVLYRAKQFISKEYIKMISINDDLQCKKEWDKPENLQDYILGPYRDYKSRINGFLKKYMDFPSNAFNSFLKDYVRYTIRNRTEARFRSDLLKSRSEVINNVIKEWKNTGQRERDYYTMISKRKIDYTVPYDRYLAPNLSNIVSAFLA